MSLFVHYWNIHSTDAHDLSRLWVV